MMLNELLPIRKNRGRLSTRRHEQVDPFAALERRAGRFFEDFFRDFAIEPATGFGGLPTGFIPNVNVTETDNEVIVSAELPGVDENDVEVSLEQGRLTIQGEKKHESETKDENCYRMERSYGSFQRVLDLPCEVDESKCDAEFKRGILTVTLPKAEHEKQKAKKIQIKST